MKKYVNYNDYSVKTEEELREIYKANKDSDSYATESFERWLNAALDKGTLAEVANDWNIINKRRWAAGKISAETGYFYDDVFACLERIGVFGNWTSWEIVNRPVDFEELQELVATEI